MCSEAAPAEGPGPEGCSSERAGEARLVHGALCSAIMKAMVRAHAAAEQQQVEVGTSRRSSTATAHHRALAAGFSPRPPPPPRVGLPSYSYRQQHAGTQGLV